MDPAIPIHRFRMGLRLLRSSAAMPQLTLLSPIAISLAQAQRAIILTVLSRIGHTQVSGLSDCLRTFQPRGAIAGC